MPLHHLEIKPHGLGPENLFGTGGVYLDGQLLKGLQKLTLHMDRTEFHRVTLELQGVTLDIDAGSPLIEIIHRQPCDAGDVDEEPVPVLT